MTIVHRPIAGCLIVLVLLFGQLESRAFAQLHPPVLGLLFTPALDHPWLNEKQLRPTSAKELKRIAELVQELEPLIAAKEPDAFGIWLIREWKRNLADPLYPAKLQAAEKLARAAMGPRRRSCIVEWPDHHELRRIELQRWLLQEKYGIDRQPNPLLEAQLHEAPKPAW